MSHPSVAIVILNYNGRKYLEQFLPAVYQTTYANWQLYVADNGSTDDSVNYLLNNEGFLAITPNSNATEHEGRYLIQMPENYGFAEGYNVALKEVEADYYILLNSDVDVSQNWVEPIIELMESDAQIGAVQPKVLMYGQQDLFEHAGAAGGWMDKWGYPFCRGRIFGELEKDEGQYDTVEEVFWATGAAMFVRAELYHALGGLDGDFFAHMEEIDLCWRMKRAGYKVMVQPDSIVWHVGGGTLPVTNPQKDYLNFRNSLATVLKNEQGGRVFWVVFVRLLMDGIAGVRFMTQGKWGSLWAIFRAHWRFFIWIPSLLRKRKVDKERVRRYAYQKGEKEMRKAGILNKSIVWQHFAKKKKKFSEL